MGREVKRVSLDFDWPMGKIWPAFMVDGVCGNMDYINNHDEQVDNCVLCKQFGRLSGWSKEEECPSVPVDLEPPTGEGWQMWETTTEGSPISPVFETPEKLAQWLADNSASSFGSCTATYEQWLAMIMEGWAPSAVVSKGKLMSGVAAASACREKD